MDVLLTHCNHVFYDEKQYQKMEPYPPLLTLQAAAVLRQSGLDVSVCDITLESPEETLTTSLISGKPHLVVVCEDGFNFLTKMCLSRNRELAFWIARVAREYQCRTAIHASDASDHVEEYLDAGFDYVLIGEVEETIRELALGKPIRDIAGLAYRVRIIGETRYTPPRPLRAELDDLPRPAWDLIDIGIYRDVWRARHNFFSMNVISSRGCPFRCNWCAKPIYGHSYRVRSPFAVAEEMLYLKTRYNPDRLWFADDIFALSARWTTQFADAVEEFGAEIPFKMQSRCDLMTRKTVADLQRAGCREVWMGAESGSQSILDAMEKGTRVEQIYRAHENLEHHGIRTGLFIQFGYPGERWEDIESTIGMIRATKPDDVGISVTYPLRGTKLYQVVSAGIGRKENWSESGDLSMMFNGTFSTEFYRALAQAIHLEVRSPNAKEAMAKAWEHVKAFKYSGTCALEAASWDCF